MKIPLVVVVGAAGAVALTLFLVGLLAATLEMPLINVILPLANAFEVGIVVDFKPLPPILLFEAKIFNSAPPGRRHNSFAVASTSTEPPTIATNGDDDDDGVTEDSDDVVAAVDNIFTVLPLNIAVVSFDLLLPAVVRNSF